MNHFYDAETDSLYIGLADRASAESQEVAPDVIIDYDAEGRVIGIDLQHASRTVDPLHLREIASVPKSLGVPVAV